jgi:hypothetical protein
MNAKKIHKTSGAVNADVLKYSSSYTVSEGHNLSELQDSFTYAVSHLAKKPTLERLPAPPKNQKFWGVS